MQPTRWILVVLVTALVLTALSILAVRGPDGDKEGVSSPGTTSSTSGVSTTSNNTGPPASTLPTTTTTSTTRPTTPTTPLVTSPVTTAPAAPTTNATTTTSQRIAVATTASPAPPFQHSTAGVTREQLGASWKPDMGCPAPEQLRDVAVSHWGYDGKVHTGHLIVAAAQVDHVVAALRDVYAARFPIQRMEPISAYGGDDGASMRANNTSAFNCRYVAGTTKLSEHGLGQAIDINPLVNPYVRGSNVDPPEGAPYADRTRSDPGMIHAGDAVVEAFARQGWTWGGSWSGGKDYQHFSAGGR